MERKTGLGPAPGPANAVRVALSSKVSVTIGGPASARRRLSTRSCILFAKGVDILPRAPINRLTPQEVGPFGFHTGVTGRVRACLPARESGTDGVVTGAIPSAVCQETVRGSSVDGSFSRPHVIAATRVEQVESHGAQVTRRVRPIPPDGAIREAQAAPFS